jgi:hypothetical protein
VRDSHRSTIVESNLQRVINAGWRESGSIFTIRNCGVTGELARDGKLLEKVAPLE